jgi:hypothetical protein
VQGIGQNLGQLLDEMTQATGAFKTPRGPREGMNRGHEKLESLGAGIWAYARS